MEFPRPEIRYSAEGDKRVVVYRKTNGLFSFREENLVDPTVDRWKVCSNSASICADSEVAWREAAGLISWLKREDSWPARHEPEKSAKLYAVDFILCPFCGKRFSVRDGARFGGNRHLTCGQKIKVQSPTANTDEPRH